MLLSHGGTGGTTDVNGWTVFYQGTDDALYVRASGTDTSFDENEVLTIPEDTWKHIAVVRDSSNVITLYYNGVGALLGTYTGNGYGIGSSQLRIGTTHEANMDFAGYMDEIRISDTARYTSNFTPSTTAFTADSNTLLLIHSNWAGGLGADSSGNYNSFAVTNLVATDQMIDVPTNNWCTMSPIDTLGNDNISLSEGNLSVSINTDDEVRGTIAIPTTGKWYWEYLKQDTIVVMVGVTDQSNSVKAYGVNTSVVYNSWAGTIYNFNSGSASYGSGWNASGTIVGIAINMDDNEITFYNNGSSQGTLTMGGTASLYNMIPTNVTGSGQADGTFNFGQDSSFAGAKTAQGNQDANELGDFYYAPPTDYLALCVDNLGSASADTFSYVGTGNVDGPFVYMGYAPSSITISSVTYDIPTAGNPSDSLDWLANGIKIRSSSVRNTSTTTYDITAAPIEQDFKHGNAR